MSTRVKQQKIRTAKSFGALLLSIGIPIAIMGTGCEAVDGEEGYDFETQTNDGEIFLHGDYDESPEDFAPRQEENLDDSKPLLITVTDVKEPGEGDPEPDSKEGAEARGYYLKSAVWQSYDIPVCWEAGGNATSKGWVRNAVETTWEATSSLDFTGWGTCNNPTRGIRIGVSDSTPHTKGLGDNLNKKRNGMVLNFTFNKWNTSCRSDRERCIRTIAIHEFGHAIGIAHEHNRKDSWKSCNSDPQGTNGDTLVGQFDSSSIMNYCYNSSYTGVLSSGDIATVRKMYGTSRTWDVGVIPDADTPCPGDRIMIRMDDEDKSNNNSRSGWNGAIVSDKNTKMSFCRVDGRKLKHLGSTNSRRTNYAVLKMGTHCPNGSYNFERYIDNEDNDNNNYSYGDIRPSTQGNNTRLKFCVFAGTSRSDRRAYSLPYLGFSYGIFGSPEFDFARHYGYFRTDDEDKNNNNSTSGTSAGRTIIDTGSNTKFHIWRR